MRWFKGGFTGPWGMMIRQFTYVQFPRRISTAALFVVAAASLLGGCGQRPDGGADDGSASPRDSSATAGAGAEVAGKPGETIGRSESKKGAGDRGQARDAGRQTAQRPKEKAASKKSSEAANKPSATNTAGNQRPSPPRQEGSLVYEAPLEELHEPVVFMSKAHEDTCLVKVGDRMPDMSLVDLDGQQHMLSELYGQRLTLVVFWTARKVFAREQFSRLEREVVQQHVGPGLNVVAVNVGDPLERVRELSEQSGATFPCLMDSSGQAFAKLATGKLPRSYLLDPQGAILWFDIEYSQGARRELRNAIEYYSRDAE